VVKVGRVGGFWWPTASGLDNHAKLVVTAPTASAMDADYPAAKVAGYTRGRTFIAALAVGTSDGGSGEKAIIDTSRKCSEKLLR
jgi:hypothetical protein